MRIVLFYCLSLLLIACTEPYNPDTSAENQQLVVEGFIEAGEETNPTFVLLTRSIPFITTIDANTFNEIFVNDARVTVDDGEKLVQLTELCLNELPPDLREQAGAILGIDTDSVELNICAYVDIFDELLREEGRSYELEITTSDAVITSTTTIPTIVPLRDFKWTDPPGVPSDTFARLLVTIDDPEEELNFYRYFTEEDNQGLIAPFSSVVDDALFNGKVFEFPLTKAETFEGDIDPENIGLFRRGVPVTIKWVTIDSSHFNFWQTLEFNRNSAGPFSNLTRVTSNVDGALGVWGGYGVQYYRDTVPFR